jgi:hypothetical protein
MKRSIYLSVLFQTVAFSAMIIEQDYAQASSDVCRGAYVSQCNSIVNITNSGATITPTGVSPYTEYNGAGQVANYINSIGIVNNSSQLINKISTTGLHYSAISQNTDPQDLDLNISVEPGNSAAVKVYNVNLASANQVAKGFSCSSAISNSMSFTSTKNNTQLNAYFTPSGGTSLKSTASACGFVGFNWQQTVTFDNINQLAASNNPNRPLTSPYNDPPPSGYASESNHLKDSYPFYFNLKRESNNFFSIANHELLFNGKISRLEFRDQPKFNGVLNGQHFDLTTQLVGVFANSATKKTYQTLGISFKWSSNYDQNKDTETGGVTCERLGNPDFDPGPQSITVADGASFSYISDYSYDGGYTITAINDILTGPGFEDDFIAQVPEPSQWMGSLLCSLFTFHLIKKYKKILKYSK